MVKVEENGDAIGGDLEPEQFRKLFIGGLTSSTTDETLKDFYSQWGQLLDCIVMRDPTTKRSRGFGFVTFTKQSEVNAAMANRPHVIDGKTVDPKRAVPRELSQRSEANISSKRLYVSGVREDHTEQMFSDYFSNYGNVIKCDIIADKPCRLVCRDMDSPGKVGEFLNWFGKPDEWLKSQARNLTECDIIADKPCRLVCRDMDSPGKVGEFLNWFGKPDEWLKSQARNLTECDIIADKPCRLVCRDMDSPGKVGEFLNWFGKPDEWLKSQARNLTECDIIADKSTGKRRGFAFVTFDDYDSVDRCVLMKSHTINNARCDVKKALSKEEMARAQQQERERMDRGMRSREFGMGGRYGEWGGPGGGRGGYGGQSWGPGGPGGQGGYGGGQGGGQWGFPGGSRAPYYGGGGWGGGNGDGWGAQGAGGGWGQGSQGGWNQGAQGSHSWASNGGQGGWGGRVY
ncbi:Heterogeneous nuclear ribonucleoprotein A1 [Toxocara canis]|uniref:Heterogeneous nuclear ribonucleoprotein A1 n=1 Tax=Toxocara canis TaxID=6265 RepID=A0A0B2VW95_TOXCA|nr:Heterogeneous nuclear ribonucleoprotein A1 [Toxocara canis]